MTPYAFTDVEGGNWIDWNLGEISDSDLEKRDKETVYVNGVKVHALAFEAPQAGWGDFARWDCINGWTATIEEAKSRWSRGLHDGPFPKRPDL